MGIQFYILFYTFFKLSLLHIFAHYMRFVCVGVSAASDEIHTWLALNNGASLEVQIAHGRELKNKSSKKLFRSWSVHRIGKI